MKRTGIVAKLTDPQLQKVVHINENNRVGGWMTWSYKSRFMPDNVHATAESIEQHMKWLHTGTKFDPRSKNSDVQRVILAIGLTWRDLNIAVEIEPGVPCPEIPLAVQNTSLDVKKHEDELRALCGEMFASGALPRTTGEGNTPAAAVGQRSAPSAAGTSNVGRKRTRSAAAKMTVDPPKPGTPPPEGPRRSGRIKDVGTSDAPPRADLISPKKPKAKKARI